jgi:dynein heavy chain
VTSTIEVYNSIRAALLPTPSKSHYTFNLRDMARVMQGVLRADAKVINTPQLLLSLWLHESQRVFQVSQY